MGPGRGPATGVPKGGHAKAHPPPTRGHAKAHPPPALDPLGPGPLQEIDEYLEHHPGGSLIPWFYWSVSQNNISLPSSYRATAKFDGSEIGHGNDISPDHAKRIAATHALKYLRDNPQPPPPPPHSQRGSFYNMRERMTNWNYIFKCQHQVSGLEPTQPSLLMAGFVGLNSPQQEGGEFSQIRALPPKNLPRLKARGKKLGRRRAPRRATISWLNYDVLLNIFEWYRLLGNTADDSDGGWKHERWWYKLTHVCRVWRNIILCHPNHLDLHLVCTYGTPVEPMLNHSPPFPLVIYYPGKRGVVREMSSKNKRGVIFALLQRDRVRRVHIVAPESSLRDMVGAMDDEYPILQSLIIFSQDDPRPNHDHNRHRNRSSNDAPAVTLHEKLRAPLMQCLTLLNVAIPPSSRLISGASSDLLSLGLFNLPALPRGFQPVHFIAQLAALSRLEMITIHSGVAVPNRQIARMLRGTPNTTRIALPCLRMLAYRGGSAFLESILARLDAPNLRMLNVEFFNQLTFSLPSFCQTVRTIDALAFRSIALHFDQHFASLIVDPLDEHANLSGGFDDGGPDGGGSGTQPLHVQVVGKALDWQVFSISQICSALAPLLSQTEHLTLGFFKDSLELDHAAAGAVGAVEGEAEAGLHGNDVAVDSVQWRTLFRIFAGVKTLQLTGEKVGDLFRALQLHQGKDHSSGNNENTSNGEGSGNDEDGGVLTPEILPVLQKLVPRGWGHTDEAFASFIAAREAVGYPVRLIRNRW